MRQDSVFSPSFGNRPTHLVGRERVLSELVEGLTSAPGSRERATVLLGQRGSGKTVLLWELADRATAEEFAVAKPTVSTDGMLERIVEKLQDAGEQLLGAESAHLTGGSVGALGFTVGLQFSREVQETKSAQYRLTQLVRKLSGQGHGTLLLIDELQANSPEVRRLVTVYQEMVGEGLNVALVMAGLPGAVSATLNDHVLTFLNRAKKVDLPELPISDVDAFFAQAFSRLNLRIEPHVRYRAAKETHGSPYLLQLVGHNIVLWSDDAGELSAEAYSEAVSNAQRDYKNDVCKTTMAALSEKDGEFLAAMSEDSGSSSIADVAQRMGVTYDYAQKYRRRLIDAGVIEVPTRGKVAFAVPFLAEYLREDR